METKLGKGRVNPRVLEITLTSVFAALYAVLVIVFAENSVLPYQIRIADMLLPLPVIFGLPAALGLGLGAAVGNLGADIFFGLSTGAIGIDMVGGSLANLIAGFLAWKIGTTDWKLRNRNISWFAATVVETIVVSLVVGSYLGQIIPTPITIPAAILGVLLGSVIAINVAGYAVLKVIGRPRNIELFRSWGLPVNVPEEK